MIKLLMYVYEQTDLNKFFKPLLSFTFIEFSLKKFRDSLGPLVFLFWASKLYISQEALGCVLEQDILSSAWYWFNPR